MPILKNVLIFAATLVSAWLVIAALVWSLLCMVRRPRCERVCEGCGYTLRGLPERTVCPECGKSEVECDPGSPR